MINQQRPANWIFDTLREAAWAPLMVLGVYGLGLTFHVFKLFPPLDIPTHFLGGVAITYFYFAGTQMVRGVQDTIVDLFVGLLGALVFSLFYKRR
jgi:hypothetical protein